MQSRVVRGLLEPGVKFRLISVTGIDDGDQLNMHLKSFRAKKNENEGLYGL